MATDKETISYLVTLKTVGAVPSSLNRRLVALHHGQDVVLGRISKNLKTEFTAKSTNGYFDNPIISRRHALLENKWGEIYVTDQSSTHGTFVNGERLSPFLKRRVESGDFIALGCALESSKPETTEHLPTELEIGLVPMHTPDRNATEDTGKISSSNSFHAPTESDGEEEPATPFSHPAWKPFAAQTAPMDGLVGHSAANPVVVESFPPHAEESTVKIFVGPEKIKESNPWVEHIEDSDIEYDDLDYFDSVKYPAYHFPYEYDTEDKESVNGESHVARSSPAYMHPVMEPRTAIEPRVVVEIGETVKDIPASNPSGTFYDVTKSDSWSMVKQYLDEEKAMLNEIQNDSESEFSDISDSYHPEDEESFDDEAYESDYDSDQDQEQDNEQDPSKIPEIPTNPFVFETVVIQDSPPAQTKTPPITPEQTFQSRKRPREEDQDQPSPSTPTPSTPSLPIRPIAPLPSPTIPPNISLLNRLQSDYTNLDTAIDSLREQNSLLRTDLERAAKRQRTERGWRDTAKSVGKYTVAGVVGGIATVVGLVWSAQG